MDKETEMIMLGIRRDCLVVDGCIDPDVWEALGYAYEVIGAESNAASCHRRAEAYALRRNVSWIAYERRVVDKA